MDYYNIDYENMTQDEIDLIESRMDLDMRNNQLLDGPGCLNEIEGIFQCQYCEAVYKIDFMAVGCVTGHASCKVCNFRETM